MTAAGEPSEIIDAEIIEDDEEYALVPIAPPRFRVDLRPGMNAEDTAVEDWLDEQRSAHTRRSYAAAIGQWRTWLDKYDCCSLGLPHRRHAFDWKASMTAAGQKPKTVDSRLVAARSFYDYLCDLPGSPLIINPIKSKKLLMNVGATKPTEALSQDEVRALTDAARKVSQDHRLLLLFLVVTGCRINEAILLKGTDLTRRAGQPIAMLTRKGNKPGAAAVDAQVFDLLLRHIEGCPPGDHVFQPHRKAGRTGAGYTYSGAYKAVRSIGITAEVMNDLDKQALAEVRKTNPKAKAEKTKVHPHMLRATLITTCIEKGKEISDIQDQVGHAMADTTKSYNRGGVRARKMAEVSGIMAEMADIRADE